MFNSLWADRTRRLVLCCATNRRGLFDAAIRAVERSSPLAHDAPRPLATHVWLEYWVGGGPPEREWYKSAIEAAPPRVRHRHPAQPGDAVRAYLVSCRPSQAVRAFQHAEDDLGRWYDLLGLAVVGIYALWGRPGRFYNKSHSSLFCAEAVARWLRSAGIPLLGKTLYYDMTPADIEAWAARDWPGLTL